MKVRINKKKGYPYNILTVANQQIPTVSQEPVKSLGR